MRLPLLAVILAGCGPAFPLPMTAGQLVQYGTGAALVEYLGQPDASTEVCNVSARGPHLPGFPPAIRDALVDGFNSGAVPAAQFDKCVDTALKGVGNDDAVALLDAIVTAYGKLVTSKHLADDPRAAARVEVAARLYLDRRAGLDAHAAVVKPVVDDLRDKLSHQKLGPIAAASANEFVANADVERGLWRGVPVTVAAMDALATAGNEMTLARFAARLPDANLRTEAMRRIVRIHIALSAFDEVRGNAAAVEDLVVKDGRNPIAVAEHPLVKAWYDGNNVPVRGVLVRQDVWKQSATLLGVAPDRPTVSVLPELELRHNLWAQVKAVSRPITVCAMKSALDPTPCISASDVSIDNPFAYLDKGASFHFADNIAEVEIAGWAGRDEFALPLAIGKQPAVTVHWGLQYELPEALDIGAERPGGRGPDLQVRVTHPNASRYVFDVGGRLAVVETKDLAGFHVASRGGAGLSGSTGSTGSTGSSGSECQSGGPGGNGGPGGDGGPGGAGGNIRLVLACGAIACDVGALQQVVFSAGGRGGSGGAGGAGGSGGSGGSGRSPTTHTDSNGNTITDDPGCSAGSSGPNGSSGRNGSDGAAGPAGHVTVVYERA